MRIASVFVFALAVIALVTSAFAVPADKRIEFTGSPMGKVVFDGGTHNKAVKSCAECHKEGVFPEMKKGAADITMEDIYKGKYCGACHNGEVTFNAMGNCGRCHVK